MGRLLRPPVSSPSPCLCRRDLLHNRAAAQGYHHSRQALRLTAYPSRLSVLVVLGLGGITSVCAVGWNAIVLVSFELEPM